MNPLIIPAILLGIVFILETLGMPDKWACLCGILVLPVTIIITAIIDHKTHYFTNKQREINKARARAKELREEWNSYYDDEDYDMDIRLDYGDSESSDVGYDYYHIDSHYGSDCGDGNDGGDDGDSGSF